MNNGRKVNRDRYSIPKRALLKGFRLLSPLMHILSGFFVNERIGTLCLIRKVLLELSGVKIEKGNFFADRGLRILQPKNICISKNCSFGHDNHFWCFSSVRVGAWTQTAKDLLIIAGSHANDNFAPISGDEQAVDIGAGCWIGARVTILGGTVIGYGSIIAAGAVVKGRFPPLSIIGGVPARIIKYRVPTEEIVGAFGKYSISEIRGENNLT